MSNFKSILLMLVLALACVSAFPATHNLPHKHAIRHAKRLADVAAAPSTPVKRATCKTRPSSSVLSTTASPTAFQSSSISPAVSSSTQSVSDTFSSSSTHVASSSDAAKTSSAHASSAPASSTHASSSHAPSASPTSTGPVSSLLKELFPVSDSQSWSTSPDVSGALPLSDATFRPEKEITDLTHSYIAAPDGKLSMQAIYPQGSFNFQNEPRGGFSFYAPGPADYDLTTAKEATFAYSVYFPEGFQFNKGGKLPGLYGGDNADVAATCSGGNKVSDCWSVRLMWRTDGAGEIYAYLPPTAAANDVMCDVPPKSVCNEEYGSSVGRGAFTWKTGAWTTVSQRVRLNDAGQANGEMELFVGGQSVINVSGLVLRDQAEGRIYGMQVQTFFGGSDSSWASPSDQQSYFSDFSIAITEHL